jgi:hypothetical protein
MRKKQLSVTFDCKVTPKPQPDDATHSMNFVATGDGQVTISFPELPGKGELSVPARDLVAFAEMLRAFDEAART